MNEERRYRDDDVRRILEIASEDADSVQEANSFGSELTLRQVQEIASEVGIAPERIVLAAQSLEVTPVTYRRWPMDVPVRVQHLVELPRQPTSDEWDVLVSRLREVFDTSGWTASTGGIHQWSSWNLEVFAEPTMQGYRLRMIASRRGPAVLMGGAGLVGIGWSVAATIGLVLTGGPFAVPAVIGLVGAGGLTAAARRLRQWAQRRARQMEDIGQYAVSLIGPAGDRIEP